MQFAKKTLSIILLSLIIVLTLTACVPSSVEGAKTKMDNAGFYVKEYIPDSTDKGYGVIDGFYANNKTDSMLALYFEDSKTASEYAKDWVDSKYQVIGSAGNWAYAGTKGAIKAFKS